MFVKKFEADNLDDALKMVKRELGPDAIILKTVTNKGLKSGLKKKRIEVTAAVTERTYEKKARVDHVLTDSDKDKFYASPSEYVSNTIDEYYDHQTPSQSNKTVMKSNGNPSYGKIGLNKVVNSVGKKAEEFSHKIKNSLEDFLGTEDPHETNVSRPNRDRDRDRNQDRANSRPALTLNDSAAEQLSEQDSPKWQSINENSSPEYQQYVEGLENLNQQLRYELNEQRHHLEVLEKKIFEISSNIFSPKTPTNESRILNQVKDHLRSLEINEKLIMEIGNKASFEIKGSDINDEEIVLDFVLNELNKVINIDPEILQKPRAKITVIFSEVNSGQSLSCLKLCINQKIQNIVEFPKRLKESRAQSLSEQVFNIHIEPKQNISELFATLRKTQEQNSHLIVDFKCLAQDVDAIKHLENIKKSFPEVEFLLCLSALHLPIYNNKVVQKFKHLCTGLLFTHLDYCMNFGQFINLSYRFPKLPLLYFGTGELVPDDLELASKERIISNLFQLS